MDIQEKIQSGLAVELGDEIIEPMGAMVIVKQRIEYRSIEGPNGQKIQLHIPEEAIKGGSLELFEGNIVAVGPSVTKLSTGDFVEFGKNSFSTKMQSDQNEYLYLYENAICSRKTKKETINA